MKIVEVKCPNCGSSLKIDGDEKTCICKYCSGQFLIKEAIKKYKQQEQNPQPEVNKVDEKVYNEVDKYIADFNIQEYKRLERIVNVLKELYPHKGLARIVILHYEFLMFFKAVDIDEFLKEPERLKSKCETYKPKSYKNIPPKTKFFNDLSTIEIKYAIDLDEILSDYDRDKYDDLCSRVFDYIETYNQIVEYNEELDKIYLPFKDKANKVAQKIQRKKDNKLRNKIFWTIIFYIFLIFVFIVYNSLF